MKSSHALCTEKKSSIYMCGLGLLLGVLFETCFYYRFFFWDLQFRSAPPSGSECLILLGSQERKQVRDLLGVPLGIRTFHPYAQELLEETTLMSADLPRFQRFQARQPSFC